MMLTIALLGLLGAVVTFACVVTFYSIPIALAAAPLGGTATAILVAAVLMWRQSRGDRDPA